MGDQDYCYAEIGVETGEKIQVQINSGSQVFRFINALCEEWGHPSRIFRIRRNRDGFYLQIKV